MPDSSSASRDAPLREPIDVASAWTGAELAADGSCIQSLQPAEIAEIEAAFRAASARGLYYPDVKAGDIPLPGLAPRVNALLEQLESGRGVALLRGLPVADYDDEDLRLMWAGIGAHIGPLLPDRKSTRLNSSH